jgi:hypothetical protein
MLGQITGDPLCRSIHGIVSLLPVCRAGLPSVGLHKLQCIEHPQGLADAATKWEVINPRLTADPFGIDQK